MAPIIINDDALKKNHSLPAMIAVGSQSTKIDNLQKTQEEIISAMWSGTWLALVQAIATIALTCLFLTAILL